MSRTASTEVTLMSDDSSVSLASEAAVKREPIRMLPNQRVFQSGKWDPDGAMESSDFTTTLNAQSSVGLAFEALGSGLP